MYKKFINLGRRKFNKIIGSNIIIFLSFNTIFLKNIFPKSEVKNNSKLKWILSDKD